MTTVPKNSRMFESNFKNMCRNVNRLIINNCLKLFNNSTEMITDMNNRIHHQLFVTYFLTHSLAILTNYSGLVSIRSAIFIFMIIYLSKLGSTNNCLIFVKYMSILEFGIQLLIIVFEMSPSQ